MFWLTITTGCYAVFPHGMLGPWAIYHQGLVKRMKKWLYWHAIEKQVMENAVCSLYTTERELRLACIPFRLHGQQFELTPYGVDVGTHETECESDEHGPLRGVPYALFLGRLHRGKHPDLLIRAWAKAEVPHPWKLVLAGPCDVRFRRELKELASRHGVEGQVLHLDFVAGSLKRQLLSEAKWFLLPSEHENFGVAVLEAVHYGCPVAVSDQVFLCDEFHEYSEVLPLKEEAWVDFLKHRLRDEAHRQSVIQGDLEAIAPKFEMNHVAEAYAERIRSIFGKRDS